MNYFEVIKTKWYADAWEEYEYEGIDCESETIYVKTTLGLANLICKHFQPEVIKDITLYESQDIKITIEDDRQSKADCIKNYYKRKEEVYEHLNYTPKDQKNVVIEHTLEIDRIYEGHIPYISEDFVELN